MLRAWTLLLSAAVVQARGTEECVTVGPTSAEPSASASAKPGAGRRAAGVSPVEDVFSLLQTHLPKHAGTHKHARALQDPPPWAEPECIGDSNDWKFLSPESLVPIPPLISVKTHKTASSTTFMIVARLTDRRNLRMMMMVPQPDPFKKMGWPGPFPGWRPDDPPSHQYDTIAHHAVFDPEAMRSYVKTSPEPFFLTVIREPGHHAVSAFNYYRDQYPPGTKPSWEEHMNKVKYTPLSGPPCWEVDCWGNYVNPQAHDLGWYQWVGNSRDSDSNSSKVDEFLSKLDAEFASETGLVILTEYFDQGLVLLRRRLGLDLREVAYVKELSAAYSFEPTEEMYQEARDALPVDMALYAHYNRTFQQLWASENAAHAQELEEELAELQALNAALQAACDSALTAQPWAPTRACPRPQFGIPGADSVVNTTVVGYGQTYLEMKEGLDCTRRPPGQ